MAEFKECFDWKCKNCGHIITLPCSVNPEKTCSECDALDWEMFDPEGDNIRALNKGLPDALKLIG